MAKKNFLEDKIIKLIEEGDNYVQSGNKMDEEAFGYFLNRLEAIINKDLVV